MTREKNTVDMDLRSGKQRPLRWTTGFFALYVAAIGGTVAIIVFRDHMGWTLPIALIAAISLLSLERLEAPRTAGGAPVWHRWDRSLLPAIIVVLGAFAVCLPSLKNYFIYDDFGYIHYFHRFSITQFLTLFHTDIAKLAWGDPRQELRPLNGLYFMTGYQLWGLHPMGYYLTSVFLHIIDSLLVFLIVKELAPRENWRAGFAALLFAALPFDESIFFWATGAPAELVPDFFYLTSFWCFMRYRSTSRIAYMAASVVAFAGCLSSKESAVTLPAMIVAYELYLRITTEDAGIIRHQIQKRLPWGVILLSAAFGGLLLGYLRIRRVVMGDPLQVSNWGNVHDAFSSLAGFELRLTHFIVRIWRFQAFYFDDLFYGGSALIAGIVLGIYLYWAYCLVKDRARNRRSISVVLFFGMVWYVISTAPLLITDLRPDHFYLPAVGLCIATGFLAFPAGPQPAKWPGFVRCLSLGLLIILAGSQLWDGNADWPSSGKMRKNMVAELQSAVAGLPDGALLIIPASLPVRTEMDGSLPFVMQEPFLHGDAYSRVRIVEDPLIYGHPWWEKTKPLLAAELAGPADEPLEMWVFHWGEGNNAAHRSKEIVPRRVLQASVAKSLNATPDSVDEVGEAKGRRLVEDLAALPGR